MKRILKGYLLGFISATLVVASITAFGANTTTLYNVIANGIKIVIDGRELNPTDANGNKVEPIIYNGTTYLPVRAIANAFGKAVNWDGSNYTVYLGKVPNAPGYPSKELTEEDNIGDHWYKSDNLKDNYGNLYSRAVTTNADDRTFETLCAMKYSRLKGVIYVADGYSGDETSQIIIKADDRIIYKSAEISKISMPIEFDIDITGCNDLKIISTHNLSEFWGDYPYINIGELNLYE